MPQGLPPSGHQHHHLRARAEVREPAHMRGHQRVRQPAVRLLYDRVCEHEWQPLLQVQGGHGAYSRLQACPGFGSGQRWTPR